MSCLSSELFNSVIDLSMHSLLRFFLPVLMPVNCDNNFSTHLLSTNCSASFFLPRQTSNREVFFLEIINWVTWYISGNLYFHRGRFCLLSWDQDHAGCCADSSDSSSWFAVMLRGPTFFFSSFFPSKCKLKVQWAHCDSGSGFKGFQPSDFLVASLSQ